MESINATSMEDKRKEKTQGSNPRGVQSQTLGLNPLGKQIRGVQSQTLNVVLCLLRLLTRDQGGS
jgi:hypothetical protein